MAGAGAPPRAQNRFQRSTHVTLPPTLASHTTSCTSAHMMRGAYAKGGWGGAGETVTHLAGVWVWGVEVRGQAAQPRAQAGPRLARAGRRKHHARLTQRLDRVHHVRGRVAGSRLAGAEQPAVHDAVRAAHDGAQARVARRRGLHPPRRGAAQRGGAAHRHAPLHEAAGEGGLEAARGVQQVKGGWRPSRAASPSSGPSSCIRADRCMHVWGGEGRRGEAVHGKGIARCNCASSAHGPLSTGTSTNAPRDGLHLQLADFFKAVWLVQLSPLPGAALPGRPGPGGGPSSSAGARTRTGAVEREHTRVEHRDGPVALTAATPPPSKGSRGDCTLQHCACLRSYGLTSTPGLPTGRARGAHTGGPMMRSAGGAASMAEQADAALTVTRS